LRYRGDGDGVGNGDVPSTYLNSSTSASSSSFSAKGIARNVTTDANGIVTSLEPLDLTVLTTGSGTTGSGTGGDGLFDRWKGLQKPVFNPSGSKPQEGISGIIDSITDPIKSTFGDGDSGDSGISSDDAASPTTTTTTAATTPDTSSSVSSPSSITTTTTSISSSSSSSSKANGVSAAASSHYHPRLRVGARGGNGSRASARARGPVDSLTTIVI